MNNVFSASAFLLLKLAAIFAVLNIIDRSLDVDTAALVGSAYIVLVLIIGLLSLLDLFRRALKRDTFIWPSEFWSTGTNWSCLLIGIYSVPQLVGIQNTPWTYPDLVMQNLLVIPDGRGLWMYQLWTLTPVLIYFSLFSILTGIYLRFADDLGVPVPASLSQAVQRRERTLEDKLERAHDEAASLRTSLAKERTRADTAADNAAKANSELTELQKTEAALRQELVRGSTEIEREKQATREAREAADDAKATARTLEAQLAEQNKQAAKQDKYIETLLQRIRDGSDNAASKLPQDEQGYTQFTDNAFAKAAQNGGSK